MSWTILRVVAALSPRAAAARLLAATCATAARRDAVAAEPPDVGELLRRADLAAVRRALATRPSRAGEEADRAHGVEDAVLAAIRAPTLLVHGRRDAVAPPAGAERARALVPGARLVVSGAGGHLPWLGPDAEETTQRIIAFLKECAGRG
jgi:pimeloyl-ACP methyl ester carboxylesterase